MFTRTPRRLPRLIDRPAAHTAPPCYTHSAYMRGCCAAQSMPTAMDLFRSGRSTKTDDRHGSCSCGHVPVWQAKARERPIPWGHFLAPWPPLLSRETCCAHAQRTAPSSLDKRCRERKEVRDRERERVSSRIRSRPRSRRKARRVGSIIRSSSCRCITCACFTFCACAYASCK